LSLFGFIMECYGLALIPDTDRGHLPAMSSMSDPNKVGVVGVETIRRAIAVRWTLRVGVGISNERHGTNWEAFPRTLAGFGQSAVTNCSPASRALERPRASVRLSGWRKDAARQRQSIRRAHAVM